MFTKANVQHYFVKLLNPCHKIDYLNDYFTIIQQIHVNPTSNKIILMNFALLFAKIAHFGLLYVYENSPELIHLILVNYFYLFNFPKSFVTMFALSFVSGVYNSYIVFFKVYGNSFTQTPCEFLGLSKKKPIFIDKAIIQRLPELKVNHIRKIALKICNGIRSAVPSTSELYNMNCLF